MKKIILGLLFFPCLIFAQIPDYSKLSKREKLHFLNYYGFVELKSGDTIYCQVIYSNHYIIRAEITDDEEVMVKYPKELKDYEYLTEIPLKDVNKLYYGVPKKIRYVKKYVDEYIVVEKVLDRKYSVYERYVFAGYWAGVDGRSSIPNYQIELYVQKGQDEELTGILGARKKKETKTILIDLFKDEVDKRRLEKIRIRSHKIIEFISKLNSE